MELPEEFIPREDEPKFVWPAIRLLGREHVERIAAEVYAQAFKDLEPKPETTLHEPS
jgi:hypothetical protein